MAWGQTSWNNAIQDWFDEVNDFVYGKGPRNKGDVVGHYTQVNITKLFMVCFAFLFWVYHAMHQFIYLDTLKEHFKF